MSSINHVQQTNPNPNPKNPPIAPSESPSPSSALEPGSTLGMEITLVNSPQDNSENDNGRLPDVVVETKIFEEEEQIHETYFSIAIQVFIPFLIAGFGMVFAGLALDKIQVSLILHFCRFEDGARSL